MLSPSQVGDEGCLTGGQFSTFKCEYDIEGYCVSSCVFFLDSTDDAIRYLVEHNYLTKREAMAFTLEYAKGKDTLLLK